jgi:hypothetical protein
MNRFAKAFTTAGILVASMLGATTAQAAPTITVTSTTANGTYAVGDQINVTINFSENVYVTGNPTITLETGPTDRTIFCNNYNSETSTSSLSCAYTVQVGDRSLDLDYQSSGAMLFNQSGQKIALTAGGAAMSLVLPAPGTAGSLSGNKALVINGEGEAEQWQSPAAAVAGLHSFVMQEDLRENVSQLVKFDANWSGNNQRNCSVAVMNAKLLSGVATLHTATTHEFLNGESITITGMANTNYNGTYTIGNASGNSFTFTRSGSPADSPSTAVRAGLASLDCSQSNIGYKSVLQVCASPTEVDCIESVQAWSLGTPNVVKDGEFDQVYPKRGAQDFLSPATGVIGGGTSSIFEFPDFPHRLSAGLCTNGENCSSLYAVTVTLEGWRSATGAMGSPSFFASITPTEIRNTTCDVRYNGDQSLVATGDGYCMDSSRGGVAVDRDGGYRCIMFDNQESDTDTDRMITSGGSSTDVSTCAMKHAFPDDVKFKINVRLSKAPAGWFHGRLSAPEITLSESNGVTRIGVAAGAVAVPTVGASGPYASFSQGVKDWFTQNCSSADRSQRRCGSRLGDGQDWENPFVRNAEVSPDPYTALSFDQLELWQDFFDDSAGAVPTNWSVRTLEGGEMQSASRCVTEATGVTGIVTTNSTLYSQGPPTYSQATGTLDYQVASPHFLNDGTTEFLGEYHLLIREDVAQCLYGFTGSEVTSSMSVVSTDPVPATTRFVFEKEDNFYHFAATGFTFSAPVIKSKLQGVQAAAAPAVDVPDVAVPAVTIPAVTIPAVTIPAVTVPAVTVPVVTVPVLTPKIGTPVVVASPPAAQVAAGLGMSAEKAVVRTSIKVPALVKGVGIKSYQVVLRSSTGKIVALQTIANPVAGKVMPTKLTAPSSGNYKVEIVATTTKGKKLPQWTSPSIRLKK